MYVCAIVSFFVFIKNLFVVIYCTRLKYTFGIRDIIGFKGTFFWLRVWLRSLIILLQWNIYDIDSSGEKKLRVVRK
jgi:hypothetical protein